MCHAPSNLPPHRSIALAGPACSGKSTVARALAEKLDLQLVTARTTIEISVGQRGLTREQLVAHGASLERERPGEWLVEAVAGVAGDAPLVVDSVRTEAQLAALTRWRPRLLTMFLTAPTEVRRRRFRARATAGEMDFDELGATAVEMEAQILGPACDAVFDSAKLSSVEIVEMIVRALSAPS